MLPTPALAFSPDFLRMHLHHGLDTDGVADALPMLNAG